MVKNMICNNNKYYDNKKHSNNNLVIYWIMNTLTITILITKTTISTHIYVNNRYWLMTIEYCMKEKGTLIN